MAKFIAKSGKVIGTSAGAQDGDALIFDGASSLFSPGGETVVKTMLQDHGHQFGRQHVYGNQVFIAGNNAAERIGGWGETNHLLFSKPRPFNKEHPVDITKLVVSFGAAHVIGDGKLYSCGDDDLGTQGRDGSPNNIGSVREFILNEDPKVYGPGIEVLDVWTERLSASVSTDSTGAVHVQVNDNGTYKLYCFGYNGYGQLGLGGTSNQGAITQGTQNLLAQFDGKRVVSYDNHSWCVMVSFDDGSLYGAGYNAHGQIGGSYVGSAAAFQQSLHADTSPMDNVIDAVTVYSEGYGVCAFALKNDGTVWSAGDNIDGGLGTGGSGDTTRFYPVKLDASTNVTGITKIIDGGRGQIFMHNETTGEVFATGRNHDGVFGDGSALYTKRSDFCFKIQDNVEKFWVLGRNEAGWIAGFWKFIGDDELYASGGGNDHITGRWNSDTGARSTLERVPFPNKVGEIIDIKYNGAVSGGGVYIGCAALTDAGEIFVWGENYNAACFISSSITHFQQPVLLNDYK